MVQDCGIVRQEKESMIPRKSGRFVSRLTRSTMAMIMAGGRGSRLEDLTAIRA
jgi:hypothetical protein